MELRVFKSLWGVTEPLMEAVHRIKEEGYDGVECALQQIEKPQELKKALKDNGLEFIALVYTEGPDHEKEFDSLIKKAAELNPLRIVSHGGRDTMSYVKQIRFFTHALRTEEEIGIPIGHETHRRRPLFSPMNTAAILRELPELRVNADFSHWCCVTESMLGDHIDTVKLAAERSVHTHGRVGYENGPQVSDPRAPEWEAHTKQHEEWWSWIIGAHKKRKEPIFTFTPEYGPPTYMHTPPGSRMPVVDLWDVCLAGARQFRMEWKRESV